MRTSLDFQRYTFAGGLPMADALFLLLIAVLGGLSLGLVAVCSALVREKT
jgi:hypothetical protein